MLLTRALPLLALITVAAGALPACTADASAFAPEETGQTEGQEQAILAERSFMLSDGDMVSATVGGDDVRFAAPTETIVNLRAGDVITSATDEKSFVRRIVTAKREGEAVVVTTSPAELSDMAKELQTRKHVDLPAVREDYTGKTLVGDANLGVKCTNCKLDFSPTLDFGIQFRRARLDHFVAEFDAPFVADLELEATARRAVSENREIVLFKKSARFVQRVGLIPIWQDVNVTVRARFEGSIEGSGVAKAGAHFDRRIHGGIQFDGAQWANLLDTGTAVARASQTITMALGGNAKLTLYPEVEVGIYSTARVNVRTAAFIAAQAEVCPAPGSYKVRAGLGVKAAAELKFFGMGPSREFDLLNVEQQVAGGPLTSPVPCVTSHAITIDEDGQE